MAAGNPFIGTWIENIDKSFWSDGSAEQSAVISIESSGDNRVKIIQDIVSFVDQPERVGAHSQGRGGNPGRVLGCLQRWKNADRHRVRERFQRQG
jgi:hypothetical protein